MRCEHAQDCGFYNLMVEFGRAKNGDCGKPVKEDCPRFSEREIGYLSNRQRVILRLPPGVKLHTFGFAVTHEETRLAYSEES